MSIRPDLGGLDFSFFRASARRFDTSVGQLPTVLSVGLDRGDDSSDGYSFDIELLLRLFLH